MNPELAHWERIALGTICSFINGRAFKTSEWTQSGLPIIRIQNLNSEDAPFNYYDGPVDKRHTVEQGDLLFAWSGTPGTSFGAHIWSRGPSVLNQHIYKLMFSPSRMDPVYFRFAINNTLDELIASAHGGVGLRHITKGNLEKTIITVPPLDQQKLIGQQLSQHAARVAAAKEQLRSVKRIGEQYKHSVLARAFGNTSAAGLYRSVLFEDLIDEGPANGWSPKTGPGASGALTLKLTATTAGVLRLDEEAVKRIYEQPAPDSRYWLESGDLLIQRANAIEHLGATAIFEGPSLTYIYPDLMMRVRINDPAKRRYIWRYLNSAMARSYLRERATGTAGSMPKISNKTMRSLPIPIPRSGDFSQSADFIEQNFAMLEGILVAAKEAGELLDQFQTRIQTYILSGQVNAPRESAETRGGIGDHDTLPQVEVPHGRVDLEIVHINSTPPMETIVPDKTRTDVAPDHLVEILSSLGGSSSPHDLWRRSEMVIDEFYKQLRQEISGGGIHFRDSSRLLEITHAP